MVEVHGVEFELDQFFVVLIIFIDCFSSDILPCTTTWFPDLWELYHICFVCRVRKAVLYKGSIHPTPSHCTGLNLLGI